MQPFISYKALFRKRKQRLEIFICYDVRFIIFSNERFKIIYLQAFNQTDNGFVLVRVSI